MKSFRLEGGVTLKNILTSILAVIGLFFVLVALGGLIAHGETILLAFVVFFMWIGTSLLKWLLFGALLGFTIGFFIEYVFKR